MTEGCCSVTSVLRILNFLRGQTDSLFEACIDRGEGNLVFGRDVESARLFDIAANSVR